MPFLSDPKKCLKSVCEETKSREFRECIKSLYRTLQSYFFGPELDMDLVRKIVSIFATELIKLNLVKTY